MLLAVLACQATGAAQSIVYHDYHVVYVEQLNMRAAPGTSADVVAVLGEGTRVDESTSKGVEADGYHWVHVRVDGKEGWLANRFIVPVEIYEATRRADELGRSGDAAAMVAEIKRVAAERGTAEEVSVSPDGKKMLCRLLADPDSRALGTDLYFAAGRGLVEKVAESLFFGNVKWSADSQYFVRAGNVVIKYSLHIYDAERCEVVFEGASYHDNFEFVDGYLVVLTTEPSDVVKEAELPAMYCVSLPAAKMSKVLEADAGDARGEGLGPREYRLRPVGKAPEAVASSSLYRKYLNNYAPSYVSEA